MNKIHENTPAKIFQSTFLHIVHFFYFQNIVVIKVPNYWISLSNDIRLTLCHQNAYLKENKSLRFGPKNQIEFKDCYAPSGVWPNFVYLRWFGMHWIGDKWELIKSTNQQRTVKSKARRSLEKRRESCKTVIWFSQANYRRLIQQVRYFEWISSNKKRTLYIYILYDMDIFLCWITLVFIGLLNKNILLSSRFKIVNKDLSKELNMYFVILLLKHYNNWMYIQFQKEIF